MMKKVKFCNHALFKFALLNKHGFNLEKKKIEEIVLNPHRVYLGHKGRKIAQGIIGETHLLRIVYEEKGNLIEIITFYPTRRQRYED